MKVALEKIAFLPFGLHGRQVALGRVLRQGRSPTSTTRTGGSCAEVPGRRAAGRARSEADFDPGAKYHVAGEHAVHALLPRAHPPVPVPPRAVQEGRLHRARCTSARSTATRRRARRSRRCSRWARASRGRTRSFELTGEREMDATRDPRVLRAAAGVARGAEQGPAVRLVSLAATCCNELTWLAGQLPGTTDLASRLADRWTYARVRDSSLRERWHMRCTRGGQQSSTGRLTMTTAQES